MPATLAGELLPLVLDASADGIGCASTGVAIGDAVEVDIAVGVVVDVVDVDVIVDVVNVDIGVVEVELDVELRVVEVIVVELVVDDNVLEVVKGVVLDCVVLLLRLEKGVVVVNAVDVVVVVGCVVKELEDNVEDDDATGAAIPSS